MPAAIGGLAVHIRSHFRSYCEFGVLAVLITSTLIYIAGIQRNFKRELAQQAGQLAALHASIKPLIFPSFRSETRNVSILALEPSTQRIAVLIQGLSEGPYDLELKSAAGEILWFQSKLNPAANGLSFELSAQPLVDDEYILLVTSKREGTSTPYRFRVKRIN